jgi:L-2-hydroxyglutarate oxidase LhgO
MVNAAGAYADVIAHRFGVGSDYKILPFKGTYKKLTRQASYLVRTNIYPVPDLRNPFLGTHFTRSVDGSVYLGPTAIPALGRENYAFFDGWSFETLGILYRDGILLAGNDAFRSAASSEPKRYLKRILIKDARKLVPAIELRDIRDTSKVGVRPQLVHWPSKKLVMDFVTLFEDDVYHVLNAISPAFTSSMAFAKHAVDTLTTGRGRSSAVRVQTA